MAELCRKRQLEKNDSTNINNQQLKITSESCATLIIIVKLTIPCKTRKEELDYARNVENLRENR
jgi:hypothetical protein